MKIRSILILLLFSLFALFVVSGVVSAEPIILSSDNTLSSLSLTNSSINPVFSPEVLNYTATVDSASTVINATPTDQKAIIVSGIGLLNLTYGENTASIIVKSERNETKTYTIKITRPDNRSTNNNLKNITISHGTIAFNQNTTIYSVTVDQAVNSISLTAELADSKANFLDGFGSPRNVDGLVYGNNAVQFKVSAENGTVKTYTVNINRNDGRSANNYLSAIELSNGKVPFVKDVLNYSLKVPYSVTSLEIFATPEDPKSIVSLNGGGQLQVGENIITVTVVAENNAERPYVFTVTRLAEGVLLSNDNYLKSLQIGRYNVQINKTKLVYTVVVDDKSQLEVVPVPNDPEAYVAISTDSKAIAGGTVKIRVTAQDSSVRDYVINIRQRPNSYVMYSLIIITNLSFILAAIVLFRYLKEAKLQRAMAHNSDQYPKIVSSDPTNVDKKV